MGDLTSFSWLDWLAWPFRRWRIVAQVSAADEVPERLPPRSIVLVGSREFPKWLIFDCPCRRGHRIMLSLARAHWPHWRLLQFDPATILPSIDFRGHDFRCHYFVRSGRVTWARDEE